jgi:hypothetical protein
VLVEQRQATKVVCVTFGGGDYLADIRANLFLMFEGGFKGR